MESKKTNKDKDKNKNQELSELKLEIEMLRKLLEDQIDEDNSLMTNEVYEISKKLDVLIEEYIDE